MWRFYKTGVEGSCELFGVNIFEYKWENTNQVIRVLELSYNKEHEMNIYKADIDNKTVTFATGELSNRVYGFYVYE